MFSGIYGSIVENSDSSKYPFLDEELDEKAIVLNHLNEQEEHIYMLEKAIKEQMINDKEENFQMESSSEQF